MNRLPGPLEIDCPFPDCGHRNAFEEDDRGAEIYCERCGRTIPVGDARHVAGPERFAATSMPDSRLVWRFRLPRASTPRPPLRNGAASDGTGRIHAALGEHLVALEHHEAGPRLLWEYRTGGVIPGSPVLHADGTLRVHSGDGRLHGVGPEGRALWPPVALGNPLSWASPVVDLEGTTWICLATGGLARVDAFGKTSRTPFFSSPARFDCTGILWNGTFVVGSEDHFLHAVDVRGARGAEKWDAAAHRGDTGWYLNSAPAATSGPTFVVATSLCRLCGFDAEGGRQWEIELPGQPLGGPVVDGEDRAFVGVTVGAKRQRPEGALVCCDVRRREIVWQAPRGAVESTPVVGSDGTVHFGDNAGWLHAVDPAGRTCWSLDAGSPIRSRGTLAALHVLVFGDEGGGLVAVRCESPALAAGWPKYMGGLSQTGRYPP